MRLYSNFIWTKIRDKTCINEVKISLPLFNYWKGPPSIYRNSRTYLHCNRSIV